MTTLPNVAPIPTPRLPPLPPGFTLDEAPRAAAPKLPPLPAGFKLDGALPEGATFAEPEGGAFLPEVGKGIASGVVGTTGTMVKGVAGQIESIKQEQVEIGRSALDVFDRIDRGETLTPDTVPPSVAEAARRYQAMPLEARQQARKEYEAAIVNVTPGDITQTPVFKAGQSVQDFAKETFPAAKDYEDSWTRSISEGLGSTVPFLATAAMGPAGPLVGATAGSFASSGEAIDRAVQAGATREQIMEAIRLGGVPGLTEQLPIEALFKNVPLPAMGRVATAVGRVFSQAAAEGGQEAVQQAAQNLIARYVYKPDQDISEGVLEAASIGGIVGGGLKGGEQIVSKVAGGAKAEPVVEAPADQAEPPTLPEGFVLDETVAGREETAAAAGPESVADAVSPPAGPSPAAEPAQRAMLRKMQWTDADIDAMSAQEVIAEAERGRAAGLTVSPDEVAAAAPADEVRADEGEAVPPPTASPSPVLEGEIITPAEQARRRAIAEQRVADVRAASDLDREFATPTQPAGAPASAATPVQSPTLAAPSRAPTVTPAALAPIPVQTLVSIAGDDIDGDWTRFTPESGTLNVPRTEMPQIKSIHRGAMVNFLNARGIAHREETVPAASLKPTQGEFSRKKVERAKSIDFVDRSILVSNDGHILDGHHQWLAKRDAGEPVNIIRLDAPIRELLPLVAEFPSSTLSEAGKPKAEPTPIDVRRRAAPVQKGPRDIILAQGGGVRDFKGELRSIDAHKAFVPGVGKLMREKGMPLDTARDDSARSEIADLAGIKPEDPFIERVLIIMRGEEIDAADAIERAAMQADAEDAISTEQESEAPFFEDEDEIQRRASPEGREGVRAESERRENAGPKSEAEGSRAPAPDRGEGREEGVREEADGRSARKSEPERQPEEVGAEGKPQTVIPGAERISQKSQAEREAAKPMRPKVAQKDAGELFDTQARDESGKQGKLFSVAEGPRRRSTAIDAYIDRVVAGEEIKKQIIAGDNPEVLDALGVKGKYLTIHPDVIWKAAGHGLTPAEIKAAITDAYNPLMAFEHSTGNIDLLGETKDRNGRPIIVGVSSRSVGAGEGLTVSSIRTVHGKESPDFIEHWTDEGRLRYLDERRAAFWLPSTWANSSKIRSFKTAVARLAARGRQILSPADVFKSARQNRATETVPASEVPPLTVKREDLPRIREIIMRVAGARMTEFQTIRAGSAPEWGIDTPQFMGGFYDPVQDIIAIAMRGGTTRTAYHEAFHRLQLLFLNDRERQILAGATEYLRQIVATERGADVAAKMSQKELEAEAFAIWADQMDMNDASGIRLHIAIRRAWERIRQALRRVRNWANGRGYQTAEDVFGRARSGQTAKRGRSARPETSAHEDQANGLVRDAHFLADVTQRPAFIEHGLRGLDVPTQRMVLDRMFAVAQNREVLQAIVETIPVDVVDVLGRGELSAERLFHDKALFLDLFAAAPDKPVSLGVDAASSAVRVVAQAAAENAGPSFEGRGVAGDGGATSEARDGRHGETVARPATDANDDDSRISVLQYSLAERVPSVPPRRAPGALVTQRINRALTAGVARLKRLQPQDRRHADDQESALDYTNRKMVDYLHPLRMMQERGGYSLNELNDAYMNARLAEDAALAQIQTMHDKYVAPMVKALAKAGASIEEFHRYLWALHAPERNRVVGARYDNQRDHDFYKATLDPSVKGASGMSDSEARQAIAGFRQDVAKYRAMQEARSHFRAMVDGELKNQRRKGLISQETYDLLTGQWSEYAPLKGQDGQDEEGFWRGGAGGFDVRGDEFKSAMGRFSESENIIAHAIVQNEQSILRQHKNEVGKATLRFLNEFDPGGENIAEVYWAGEDGFGDLLKAQEVYKRKLKDGKVVSVRIPNPFSNKDDVLAAKVGGKTYWIRFKDPKIGLALRKMGVEKLGLFRLIRPLTVWQSIINTRANPAFTPINIVRDVQTGAIHLLDEGFSVGQIGQVMKDIPKAWMALWRHSRKRQGTSEWDRYASEYFDAGGKITFNGYLTIEDSLKDLKRQIGEINNKTSAKAAIRKLIRFIGDINDAGENGIRLAAYVAARKQQKRTAKEAAFMARDLTVDFKKHGEFGPALNSLFVFFNAALQGNRNIWVRALKSRKVQAAVASFIFAGMMQHVWNSLMAGDDDDGENAYRKMLANEPWKLERQFVFFLPDSKSYVSFPMPYGYNAFHHMGVQGAAIMSGDKKPVAGLLDAVRVWWDAMNPIGSGSLLSMVSPTAIDPIVDLYVNENVFGSPIYPSENQFDPAPPPKSEQSFSTTHPVAKWVAETVNEMTGGNAIEPGSADWYPDALEHLWGYATGGLGRFVSQGYQTAGGLVKGDIESAKVPIFRSFYGEVDKQSQRTDYFRKGEAVEWAGGKLKEYQETGVAGDIEDFMSRYPAEVEAIGAFKAAEKTRREINKQRRGIEASNMPAGEREAELDALDQQEMDAMKDARQAYADATKRQRKD